jgi:hypothetical protein
MEFAAVVSQSRGTIGAIGVIGFGGGTGRAGRETFSRNNFLAIRISKLQIVLGKSFGDRTVWDSRGLWVGC